MYSISRHLTTFQSGGNFLRQIFLEHGIKRMTITVTSSAKRCQAPFYGRRYLSVCRRESCCSSSEVLLNTTHPIPLQLSIQRPDKFAARKLIISLCRYYSQSAENVVAKEELSATAGEEQKTEGENPESVVEAGGEDFEGYHEDEDSDLILTEEEIQELTNGDEELIKRIKYIQLEYSVMQQDGEQVPSPSFVKFKYWKELMTLNSKSKRKKFYLYLFKTEMKERSQLRKKEEKRQERLKMFAENPILSKEEDIYGTVYALARNTLFLRLYDTTVTKFYHCRAASAMMHHPPLVIDCSYDEFMTYREAKNCAQQLELLITENRTHPEPFNLYICNAGRETKMVSYLDRLIPTIRDDGFAVNLHEESYLDIFPKERLVYLTPHTRDELDEYNEDDIYIIGGMVDKSDNRPHSLAKAKKLNLRMKRLPLEKYLMWGLGGKALTLNHMVKIMLDLRYSRGDWKTALKHVPMRKLCRDFHPYPNQVQNYDDDNESRPAFGSSVMPHRKERKSFVMEDFELLNKRRGYRRSDMFSSPGRRSNQTVNAPRVRSLFHDDD